MRRTAWARREINLSRAVSRLAAFGRVEVARGWSAACRRRFSRIGRAARWPMSLAAAAILMGALATPASASGSGWSITPSPNPEIPTGQLFWVTCPTANSCMAVGTYVRTSGVGVNLAEQWNGTSWRILATPNPPGIAFSGLLGVSCTAPSACTAVGASTSRAGASQAVVERWNGTSWRIQTTPNPPQGGGFLNGVSCTSSSACTAVGTSNAGTLAERWNGTNWHIQATPNPSQGGGGLSGVSCMSSSACTAVGASNAGTLAEQWNGTRWRVQTTANPPQGGGFLTSVSCTSSSACAAVGVSNAGTLAERWNGASWSIQATPTPSGAQFAFLNSVSCTSSSACTAAGAYVNSSGNFQTLAERWDGSKWSTQATPNRAGADASLLIGVTCTSATACIAVGYANTNQSPAVVVERWNDAHWHLQAAPNPPGAASSSLNSVSCTSRSACVTVGGATSRSGTVATLAERWNGRTWRIQATPSPSGGGALNSVSCMSRSACTAVGGRVNGRTLAERWNGTRWRIQATPNPAGGGFLASVSCTSRSACTAVGNSANGRTLAERWNGTRWRIQATPNASGTAASVLGGVACTSRTACMAVGGRFDSSANAAGTLAERWNGNKWRIVPTPKSARQGSNLGGVACTSSSACTAVGSSGVTTLAERWNGTSWHVQATPNPPGGQDIFLNSVACPASSACTAFGLDFTGSGPLTLAERWSGGKWRIQPTPRLVALDLGPPGVACPTSSACFAVASYTNNGPNLTLAEQWNRTAGGSPATFRRPAGNGGLAVRCARFLGAAARGMPRIPASPWRWSGAGAVSNRTSQAWPDALFWCSSR